MSQAFHTNSNILCNEHRRIVKVKIFALFTGAKNFKDTSVRAKVYQPTEEQAERALSNAMAEEAVEFVYLL